MKTLTEAERDALEERIAGMVEEGERVLEAIYADGAEAETALLALAVGNRILKALVLLTEAQLMLVTNKHERLEAENPKLQS